MMKELGQENKLRVIVQCNFILDLNTIFSREDFLNSENHFIIQDYGYQHLLL